MEKVVEKKENEEKVFITESIQGLYIGLALMIVVFLFVHYVLGIKAFS